MSKKQDDYYFDNFMKCAEYSCKAAYLLKEILTEFQPEEISKKMEEIHEIERQADTQRYEITDKLAKAFITPIEREDIVSLSVKLDDVVDAIEDVMRRIYMFDVKEIRPEVLEFTKLIVEASKGLKATLTEFRNFKSSKIIKEQIVAVNTVESKGDYLHTKIYHKLFSDGTDTRDIIIWTNIFDELEDCLDACEEAVDVVELVIMKNS